MIFSGRTILARPGIVHGFTSRVDPDGEPLDLGPSASARSWDRAARAVGMPGAGIARVAQVHGSGVVRVDGPGTAGEADAIVTATPGLLVAVRVADCVPIVVAGASRVGAIHAGWRGVAAGVVAAALEAIGEGPVVAVVGPSIGAAAYEVGEEVVEAIAAAGVPEEIFLRRHWNRPHVDLRGAVAWQLREAGVGALDVLEPCTHDDPRFYSYRRDGAGRGHQAGLIGIVPSPSRGVPSR